MSPSTTTTRWCPTPEQLMILEELYRRGLRTPNASQIQRITAHLALYGKIQGKNVFYWFQNHKARDRQKLRKKLAKQLHQQHQHLLHHYQLDPPPFPQHYLHPQVNTSGVCEEEVPVMTWQKWRGDLPKDCSNSSRSYGHDDSIMIMDVGPTFPYCTSKLPLQTLELFPLRPPSPEKPSTRYFDAPLSK